MMKQWKMKIGISVKNIDESTTGEFDSLLVSLFLWKAPIKFCMTYGVDQNIVYVEIKWYDCVDYFVQFWSNLFSNINSIINNHKENSFLYWKKLIFALNKYLYFFIVVFVELHFYWFE